MNALGLFSLGTSAASTVMSAIGASASAKQANAQAQIAGIGASARATQDKVNAGLSNLNAENALALAKTNSDFTLNLADVNADMTTKIADLNVQLMGGISDFNQTIAAGNAALIVGKGAMEAAVARGNATLAEKDAQDALEAGNKAEQTSDLHYARLKSTQRATLAANGIALDEGSALRIQTDTDFLKDVDAQTLHLNAVRQAMGYRVQAANYETQADFATINAKVDAMTVQAQAMGAKLSSDRDILNVKLGASYQALETVQNARVNAQNITDQGNTEAWNQRLQAMGYSAQAAQEMITAASAKAGVASPTLAAATSLVGGASNLASKWYSMSKSGSV